MTRRLALALLFSLAAGCSTLPAEQSAGLKEAQRIADEVTKHYGVGRVRVYIDDRASPTTAAGYSDRNDWILVQPADLAREELVLIMAHLLGHVTLRHRAIETSTMELRKRREQQELDARRRGVEIMVWLLGITEREAVDRYATYLVKANNARGGRAIWLPPGDQHPCVQLRDLWTAFAITDPIPKCEIVTTSP